MTESYTSTWQRYNQVIIGAMLGGLLATAGWFGDSWLSGRIEMVTVQTTLAAQATTIQAMTNHVQDVLDKMETIQNQFQSVIDVQKRISDIDSRLQQHDRILGELNNKDKALEAEMDFYHQNDGNGQRKTLKEWEEELRRRRKNNPNPSRYNDEWDGMFRENQSW